MLRLRIFEDNVMLFFHTVAKIFIATLIAYGFTKAGISFFNYIDYKLVPDSNIALPIFVVSSNDKIQPIEWQLRKAHIKYKRFSGINWKQLVAYGNKRHSISLEKVAQDSNKESYFSVRNAMYPEVHLGIQKEKTDKDNTKLYMNYEEIGELFNHFALLDLSLKKELKQVLILNDKVKLLEPFIRLRLKKIINNIPKNFDVYFLSRSTNNLKIDLVKKNELLFQEVTPINLQAYIINLQKMTLIEVVKNVDNIFPLDITINTIMNTFPDFKIYISTQPVIKKSHCKNIRCFKDYEHLHIYKSYRENVSDFLNSNINEKTR